MKFSEIPQFTRDGNYRINMPWRFLEGWIRDQEQIGLNLDPDFQRAHVWTEAQQIAFVEFKLKGGIDSNIIRFNCPGWMHGFTGPFELVDGKQRLAAVRKFMANELRAFDCLYSEFEDKLSFTHCDVIFLINDLPLRSQVLQWYLDINAGGVVHTEEELNHVRELLKKENHVLPR